MKPTCPHVHLFLNTSVGLLFWKVSVLTECRNFLSGLICVLGRADCWPSGPKSLKQVFSKSLIISSICRAQPKPGELCGESTNFLFSEKCPTAANVGLLGSGTTFCFVVIGRKWRMPEWNTATSWVTAAELRLCWHQQEMRKHTLDLSGHLSEFFYFSIIFLA